MSTKLCPNCEEQIESSKFFLHQRMCENNVRRCPKCNKPFIIEDLEDHINYDHAEKECDLCHLIMKESEIENHKKNKCENRQIECSYCGMKIRIKEYYEHKNICGSRSEECPICGKLVVKKNMDLHVAECMEKAGGKDERGKYEKYVSDDKRSVNNNSNKIGDYNRNNVNKIIGDKIARNDNKIDNIYKERNDRNVINVSGAGVNNNISSGGNDNKRQNNFNRRSENNISNVNAQINNNKINQKIPVKIHNNPYTNNVSKQTVGTSNHSNDLIQNKYGNDIKNKQVKNNVTHIPNKTQSKPAIPTTSNQKNLRAPKLNITKNKMSSNNILSAKNSSGQTQRNTSRGENIFAGVSKESNERFKQNAIKYNETYNNPGFNSGNSDKELRATEEELLRIAIEQSLQDH